MASAALVLQVVQLLQSQGVPPRAYPKPQEGFGQGSGLGSVLEGQAMLHIRREVRGNTGAGRRGGGTREGKRGGG